MARTQKRIARSGATRYVAKWRDPDGTDHSKGGFTAKKAAADYARNAESAAAQGIVFDPAKGKMPFQDAAVIWLESRRADTRNNAENHRYALAPAHTRRGDGKTLGIDAVFWRLPVEQDHPRVHPGVGQRPHGGGQEAVHRPARVLDRPHGPGAGGRGWPAGEEPR